MHTTPSATTLPRLRRWAAISLTAIAIPLLAAGCGSAKGGSSGGSDSGSNSTATWAAAYCKNLATYETSVSAEAKAFNDTNPTDAAGLKAQEVDHLQKYLSIVNTMISSLKNSGKPDVPDGQGYVDGYLKAFTTLQTTLTAQLANAKGIDTTEDSSTLESDLQDISSAVNDAFQQFTSDWNDVDKQFTNPGDNDLVHALNGDSNCDTFRKGGK